MFSKSPTSSNGKAPTPSDSAHLSLTNPLSNRTKKRVRDIDPNENKCLVENCSEQRAINFAHVCPKWFANRRDEMDRIEWYWNMAHETLNLDTRWNIMRLGSSIHRLFDKFSWVLIPEESIVDQYFNSLVRDGRRFAAIRENFPEIDNSDDFEYNFLPIDDDIMCKIALLRQNDPPKEDPPKDNPLKKDPLKKDPRPLPVPLSNDFVIHTYPFDTMPVLKSHVHPKFVILEVGVMMSKAWQQLLHITDNYPVIRKIIYIYNAWTAPLPDNWMEDRTYNLPSPDPGNSHGSDVNSECTERARNKPPKRRRPQDVSETPTLDAQNQRASGSSTQGKQRALKREPFICLSKKSLKLHDRSVGTGNWTHDTVQKWSEKCRPLPHTTHTP